MSFKRDKWACLPTNGFDKICSLRLQMTNKRQLFSDIQRWFLEGASVYDVQGKVNQKYQFIMPISLLSQLSCTEHDA